MKNSDQDFLIIAHRGWSAKYPENTLLAFDKAIEIGAKALEFDVQLDGDDEAVVFHDFVLGRTTHEFSSEENIRVRDLSTEQFLELDVGTYKDALDFYDTPPALLSQVLGRYRDQAFLNIELKVFDDADDEEIATLAKRTLEVIDEQQWSHGIISSFCPTILAELKKMRPKLPLALLGPKISELNLLESAIKLGVNAYNFDGRDGVTESDIAAIHSAGLKAYAYTINNPIRVLELKQMGVDGIFTDYPDQYL
jgi:glycerophosphoryl diester phosphodiesterase